MRFGHALIGLVAACLAGLAGPAFAQSQTEEPPPSQCLAIASALPNVIYASAAASENPLMVPDAVTITFKGHSTYLIETPAGVTIATDFSGIYGANPPPRVITMNRAHSSHYTLSPDERIDVVLPGWNPDAPEPAEHHVVVDDVYIRNVTTDIRSWDTGGMIPDANSIFIFEVAGLCIGHLGHLHHKLSAEHLALIGRLDVVFAPVDGSMTLDLPSMIEVLKDLRASLVIPMHYFGRDSLNIFLAGMADEFDIKAASGATIEVSLRSLPQQPTVMVLAGG